MKGWLSLLLVTSCAVFAQPPLPDFSAKIDLAPSLSLTDSIKAALLPPKRSTGIPATLPASSRPAAPRAVISRMPVLEPSESITQNMPIATPDPSVDFNIIVKTPDVASEK